MDIKLGHVQDNGINTINHYYLVSDFEPSNKGHWQAIRKIAGSIHVPQGRALMAAFMDLKQHYEPSQIGHDIGEPYMERVIAQYVVTIHGKQLFFSNSFGSDKYIEPGHISGDFNL